MFFLPLIRKKLLINWNEAVDKRDLVKLTRCEPKYWRIQLEVNRYSLINVWNEPLWIQSKQD